MLYELENAPFRQKPSTVTVNKLKNTSNTTCSSQANSEQTFLSVKPNGVTSDKIYGPELPAALMNKLPSVNGIAKNSLNGKNKPESSSSSESDSEVAEKPKQDENCKKTLNTPTKRNTPINGDSSSKSPPPKLQTNNGSLSMPSINHSGISNKCGEEDKKLKSPPASKHPASAPLMNMSSLNSSLTQSQNLPREANKQASKGNYKVASSAQVTKLVPYDMDDSSNCSDESSHSPAEAEPRVTPKATVGNWKVTDANNVADEPSSEGKSWDKKKMQGDRSTVNELLRMSHSGYGAPVSSWNGTRAQLDKEVSNERRENNRKRPLSDTPDQGRNKHQKMNVNGSYKSNPGYNPIQVSYLSYFLPCGLTCGTWETIGYLRH